jgi:DNA invertase Pin-like site-specific DNA recombinase
MEEEKPAARRAAIYARLSVDRDGTKVGIDTQLQDSRRLAAEKDWVIVDEYVDRNLTAADKLVRRPEYDRLVGDFRLGRFDALICWDLDRLTRQPRQLEDWIDSAEGSALALITANGEADLSVDGGRLYARLKVAVAKGEAERASARQKRNKQHRREKGLWHGGGIPYGYRVKEKHLVLEPVERERIEEAAHRLLEDRVPLHQVVAEWNARGVTTRTGKHWRQSNLRSILMNRSLLGETKAGVAGWEPVLDVRTFDRLNALFSDPDRKLTHSPGVKGGKYSMGGGLTVCGKCGKSLTSQLRAGGGSSLLCNKQVQGPDLKNHPQVARVVRGVETMQDTGRVRIDHDSLESYVFSKVLELLDNTPRWQQRMSEQDPGINDKVDALETQRGPLREQRERAGRAFVLGVMSEREAQREVERIDGELERLDREVNDLLGRPVLAGLFENGFDWQAWSPAQRRAALRGFIDRVIVNDWPEGVPRNVPRFRGEDDESFEERKRTIRAGAIEKRVQIVWKWAA